MLRRVSDLVVPAPRGGPDVTTFGEAMVVLVADAGVPLHVATRFARSVAGSELNVSIGLARAGYKVAFHGRVGADAFGEVVVRALLAEGIDTGNIVTDTGAPTGLIVRDAHAERAVEVVYYRAGSAASRHCLADVDIAEVAGSRMLYATGITPLLSSSCWDLTPGVMRAAREAGTLVVFDPNLRTRLLGPDRSAEVLLPLADLADIVLTGVEEGEAVTGAQGDKGVAGAFLDRGASLVVVKRGSRGVWATDGSETWEVSPPPARVLDPVGAGDAFNAGFLARLLDGWGIEAALETGALFGRLAVQTVGDVEGLPTRRQLSVFESGSDVVR